MRDLREIDRRGRDVNATIPIDVIEAIDRGRNPEMCTFQTLYVTSSPCFSVFECWLLSLPDIVSNGSLGLFFFVLTIDILCSESCAEASSIVRGKLSAVQLFRYAITFFFSLCYLFIFTEIANLI